MCRILAKSLLPFGVAAFCGIAVYYLTAPVDAPPPKFPEPKWTVSGGNSQKSGKGADFKPPSPVRRADGLLILAKPAAIYTDAARGHNIEGSVRLKVTLLENGTVGTIVPVTRLPYGLTEQAIGAAKKIRFEPKKINGVPAPTTVTIDYSFSIY